MSDDQPSSSFSSSSSPPRTSPLGPLPHQLRGFLSTFSQLAVTGFAFPQCTACSSTVLQAYSDRGFDFLLEAFNQPLMLEDLTGLSALHAATEGLDLEWDDGSEEGEMGGEGGDGESSQVDDW
eukprot:TRINITY_DN24908_c0_g1_i1.p1 TRINITY_DN24908_c0_g1~~TRINITY_DN24908_c0_g1_i1.p1  ORF type:complete len:141 (+),score=11.05 TRINITY_DN24908_c0_g1_i1:55-423(+)